MRTLIFATKEHIEYINEFKLFFKPFSDKQVVFCEWNQEGQTLDESVPGIYKAIDGARNWRAIILYDPGAEVKKQVNPFDLYQFDDKDRLFKGNNVVSEMNLYSFSKQIEDMTNHRKSVYDRACTNPLTRLSTYLCKHPLESKIEKNDEVEDNLTSVDSDEQGISYEKKTKIIEKNQLNAYRNLADYKSELRKQIMDKGTLRSNMPDSVHCVSLRTIKTEEKNDEDRVRLAWLPSEDAAYYDFCDSNMYFEGMRFFVFDILPENHINYRYEYLKFIFTLLIFASNDIPVGSASPRQLYVLESLSSEEKLRKLINAYINKLDKTISHLESSIEVVENNIPKELSDVESETAFHSSDLIPVNYDSAALDGLKTKLFPSANAFKLADKCPDDEKSVWGDMHKESIDTMLLLFKQPLRSLERATEYLRDRNEIKDDRVLGLNHFQLQDLEEFVDNEESKMIDVEANDFYDKDKYLDMLNEDDKQVKAVLETRMTGKTTVMLFAVTVLAFLLGFIPFIVLNKGVIGTSFLTLVTITGTLILAAVAFIYLFVLKKEVTDKVDKYNEDVRAIKKDIDDSMNNFERYLSLVCHVMKGKSVINASKKTDNTYKQHVRILRGHIQQIRDRQSEIYELFGEFVFDHDTESEIEPYDYNFDIVREYEYPIPFPTQDHRIPYIQDVSTALVPFDFVDRIDMHMEELYE